jgi:nucleoside-diphosphate kinase
LFLTKSFGGNMFDTLGVSSKRDWREQQKRSQNRERLSFIVNYDDKVAQLIRQYILIFYVGDNSIEMYDQKSKKIFLKRIPYPSIQIHHLYVGGSITVNSRLLKIVDYGDNYTKTKLAPKEESND